MIKQVIFVLLTSSGLAFQSGALAGEFSVNCSYNNDNLQECANLVTDIVTDKFTAKFPATKYQIFVHSNVHSYTNGGYAAYAVAGVVPKRSGQFPKRAFSASNINRGNESFSRVQLAEKELETYRDAVRNLMEQCDISPTCDVYSPRK